MPNKGLTTVVERTIADIKSCLERLESLHFTALGLIQEMPDDKVGDNLDVKLEELKELAKQINKQPRKSDKIEEERNIKRCIYWNRGYCREAFDCLYSHEGSECQSFLTNGHCGDRTCRQRHRRTCKYWSSCDIGCIRGTNCQYLHKKHSRGDIREGKQGNCDQRIQERICLQEILRQQ